MCIRDFGPEVVPETERITLAVVGDLSLIRARLSRAGSSVVSKARSCRDLLGRGQRLKVVPPPHSTASVTKLFYFSSLADPSRIVHRSLSCSLHPSPTESGIYIWERGGFDGWAQKKRFLREISSWRSGKLGFTSIPKNVHPLVITAVWPLVRIIHPITG